MGTCSRPVGASWPLIGVWQDQAWLARTMVAEERSSPNESEWFQRESSTAEISSSFSSDELGESSGSASPEWDDQAAANTAVGAMTEEESFQVWNDDSTTERGTPASSEESAGKTEDLSFLKQLWKIARSNEFQSIWWVDDGVFVAINEDMFKKEVLARRDLGEFLKWRVWKVSIVSSTSMGCTNCQRCPICLTPG